MHFRKTAQIPITLKIIYFAFLILLVPIYFREYGAAHFLWFSDITLFLGFAAVVFEHRLIASMAALCGLVLESFWILDFLVALGLGTSPSGLTEYMIDSDPTLLLRSLSLFHVFMPPLLIWLICRLGYDRRALLYQALLAWVILIGSYVFGDQEANINWVYGPQQIEWITMPNWLYIFLLGVGITGIIYPATHYLLLRLNFYFYKG